MLDENRDETITRINSKLPPCIRVQAIRKVTKNFNCKSACDARTYLYMLPTFAFAPILPINELKPQEEVKPEMYVGMFSHKKSLITIFGHKHKIKNFIKKFDIFHKKNFNSLRFWFIFGIKLRIMKQKLH